jgi:hypothetical protein
MNFFYNNNLIKLKIKDKIIELKTNKGITVEVFNKTYNLLPNRVNKIRLKK